MQLKGASLLNDVVYMPEKKNHPFTFSAHRNCRLENQGSNCKCGSSFNSSDKLAIFTLKGNLTQIYRSPMLSHLMAYEKSHLGQGMTHVYVGFKLCDYLFIYYFS